MTEKLIRPIPAHEELSALLDSVGDLLHALHNNGPVDGCADRVRAALAAPSFKERTDGE